MTEFDDVIRRLEDERPQASARELDEIKQRVRRRAADPSRKENQSMKSRFAILAMLVTGMLLSTAGAGLALQGDNASVSQYGTPVCTPTPTPPGGGELTNTLLKASQEVAFGSKSPADAAGPNEADVITTLKPRDQWPKGWTQDTIAEQISKKIQTLPGINFVMAQPISDRVDEMVTGVRADVAVKVFGDDLEQLVAKANEISKVAATIRGLRDSRIDRVGGQQYLNITIDRQAIARFGLNASDIHDMIETAIGGKAATEIYEGERRFQAVVRYPERLRHNVEEIRRIVIHTPDNGKVLLENLAKIDVVEGPAQINRDTAKRRIVVGLNVQDRDLGGFVAELKEKVGKQVQLPPGYFIVWGGQFQNMERALEHLKLIVPITIGAIFFLLFLLFGSLRFAALIITVLPFASIGGVVGLFATGEYLSVPASVGFIALWGIAVLNGVVLVSYIRKLRESGLEQKEAIAQGAMLRFRPVMMTATVAALGLVPFLFATGPGSEVQRPLAIVLIGGLFTSTPLTLVVVPVLYRFFEARDPQPPAEGPVAEREPVPEHA